MSVKEFLPSDDGTGLRVVVVAAQWNETIVRRLLDGALGTLRARGVADDDVEVWWVPGSFELPDAAAQAALWGRRSGERGGSAREFHAVVALGCVIRGETEHFRLVADAAARGLSRVALDTGVPVLDGVLAVENVAQAEARSGGPHGNFGSQAALAAIRMANLHRAKAAS